MLLVAGDIALNPGLIQHPYTLCSVQSNQCALCCDVCQQWTHAIYGRVSTKQYSDMVSQEEFPWCCPLCLLSQLLFFDEDIVENFVDTTIEDHSDDLLIISDVLCGFCSKLKLIHHKLQGLWSKWDDLSGWMAASADSASLFCFSKVWMKSQMTLYIPYTGVSSILFSTSPAFR